jgi:poly-gamma-glutamate synthesis protein (capsule biosynthesis protein)
LYYVANGQKIAILSATEIERSTQYTREATERRSGVLKTLDPEYFVSLIEKAKADSDYVIVFVHWGTEGTLFPDKSQQSLAEQYVQAGADAVIGSHPHRLQGTWYVEGVPVAYSLGNFWFSDATLYTTLAQVVITDDGLTLRYLPCVQEDLTTRLLTEDDEKEEFYQYLAAISGNIGIDEAGNVYDKKSENYSENIIAYDSDTASTPIRALYDNDGYVIDIVGNRR